MRPACASRSSADTFSASESCLSTRTDGWCMPRSSSLRYGFDKLVISASWRSVKLASLRWLRTNAPKASICASHWLLMTLPSGAPVSNPDHPRSHATGTRATARGRPSLSRAADRRWAALLRAVLLRIRGTDRQQRPCGLEQVLGELALARQQLLGEIVGTRHNV